MIHQIQPPEVKRLLDSGAPVLLLDVRQPDEHAFCALPGSVLIPLGELAAFQSARDLAQFVVPRMAHMHDFAGTRALMWRRIDAFIAQVAALRA